MNNETNYIKIKLTDSYPVVSIEYEDLTRFQELMFCLISDRGSNLIYKTIESELIENNKKEEIEIIGKLLSILSVNTLDDLDKKKQSFTNPSSFK